VIATVIMSIAIMRTDHETRREELIAMETSPTVP
jgi:hypothetical protein